MKIHLKSDQNHQNIDSRFEMILILPTSDSIDTSITGREYGKVIKKL